MPIVKCKNHIEVYEHKARSKDAHELSGRTGRQDLTKFISNSIVSHLATSPADVLVDIGCGDGTLLELVAGTVYKGIGVLPTAAEVERVRHLLRYAPNIQIQKGVATSTELPSQIADKVVCNGVFILLTDPQVDDALQEIARISKPHSLLFIGEVPFLNEFEGREYGDSIAKWLWWVLKNQGIHSFLARLRQTTVAFLSNESLVIAPKAHYFSEPDKFIEMVRKHGMALKAYFRHREITITGEEYDSKSRVDYLFERAKD